MRRTLFSDAVSALLDVTLIGFVVTGLVAAVLIIVGIAALDVFFTLLGYLWMPALFVIALFALAHHQGRWYIATIYPTLTGLILWAYHWPVFAAVGLPVIEAVMWFALSIPLMGRRDAKLAAEDARILAKVAAEKARVAAQHTPPPAPVPIDVHSSANDFE